MVYKVIPQKGNHCRQEQKFSVQLELNDADGPPQKKKK